MSRWIHYMIGHTACRNLASGGDGFSLRGYERYLTGLFAPKVEEDAPIIGMVLFEGPIIALVACRAGSLSIIANMSLDTSNYIFPLFGLDLIRTLPPCLLKKVIAEVISTFLLVFVTCGSAALHHSDPQLVSQLGASVAGGLIVTVMIYSVGHISGAHMNPAVTLAFAALRHFPWIQVPFYLSAQLTGALIAAFTLRELLHPIQIIGTTTPSGTAVQALMMEIIITFSMMFVTSAVATDTRAVGELAGLAVGSAVCITSIFAGPISGGSMNPARSIAPAVASNKYDAIWVYILGPVIGTLLGAWSYTFIRLTDTSSRGLSHADSSFKLRGLQSQDATDMNNYGSEIL